MNQIDQKTMDLIKIFTKGKKHLKLDIGFIDGDNSHIKTFTETDEIDYEKNIFEIGSVTKTFTASLLAKYVYENKIHLNDPINNYITGLASDKYYPSLLKLATHTSGYSQTYPMTNCENLKLTIGILSGNAKYLRQNPLNIDPNKMLDFIQKSQVKNKDYKPKYSNFGIALLGYVISSISGKDYWETMNDFVKNELGLQNTYLGTSDNKNIKGYNNKNQDCGNWKWEKNNLLMAPSGALSSTAEDLLAYANAYIQNTKPYFALCRQEHISISKNDGMGLSWNLDKKNGIISHTGGTGCFFSCLVINVEKKSALVFLSNYRSNMGLQIKILNSLYDKIKN